MFLCLLFPVFIEILLRMPETAGALTYAEPGNEISLRAVCLLNYLPTLIGFS